MGCLFTFLMVFFCSTEVFNFHGVQFIHFLVAVTACAFGVILRNCCLIQGHEIYTYVLYEQCYSFSS